MQAHCGGTQDKNEAKKYFQLGYATPYALSLSFSPPFIPAILESDCIMCPQSSRYSSTRALTTHRSKGPACSNVPFLVPKFSLGLEKQFF